MKNMTRYFKKLRNQMRRSVRSQIFVGFPASLSLCVLICSFSGFVNMVFLIDTRNLGRGEERAGENYLCTKGISHLLHGTTCVLVGFSFSQQDAGFFPCVTAWTTSASPAEFDGMNRVLKHPEATQAFCKVFGTKKRVCQPSPKVITIKRGC